MADDSLFRDLDSSFVNFDEAASDTFNYTSTDIVVHWNWKLDIPVSLPGSTVSYTFSTTAGDIGFGISFEPNEGEEVEVLEEHRVPSNIEPISGAFKAPSEGAVCLYWDNSFSWLTPKKLSYSVEVRQPSFAVADQARSTKARSMLYGSLDELRYLQLQLSHTLDKERALKAEIPELKRQFDEIKAKIESKLAQVTASAQESASLTRRLQESESRINGLCIRTLNKELLGKVLDYLRGSGAVGCVCKYWAAIVKEHR
mmetsp:Transcript_6842/g.10281  ORF Transcript_6842/g.10281 Transcript_6842/m.10281 type:complete len:257 (+) Transcript_6842:79-849(+)|eukprot:CAMPEP_0185026080 /NCGR_PEP_ID=MMETSP1103-20130426/9833_1 /TAXON_ID=36769 /ORGANISM="Paraphysomonas bandaiensis, Strain Caron Lab Isolate" /LENGTH=256 /DNA_ID=CAMNT_0027559533 /DNA_START=29 /DNA_END=799 /DNA_ORIENTATION=+